jgi:hypothetical protein
MLAKTVGADPLDIQSTFVGAICRWQAANPAGLIDITRFWFEQGSLDNERKVAEFLKYQIESRAIAGVASIVMRPNDPNGACGVASDAAVWSAGGSTPSARNRRLRAGHQTHGAHALDQFLISNIEPPVRRSNMPAHWIVHP